MSEYGVSALGFKRKRLDLLLAELNSEVKAIFGDNFNVSPESPDGQINGVLSESDANLWELAEHCYNAFSPSKASGNTLSDLVQLNNITREPAIASVVLLTISGDPGTVIPAGSIVSVADAGIRFTTDQEVAVPAGGSVDVLATATVTGPLTALADSVTLIDSPVAGWDSVTNNNSAIVGQNIESDSELRARRIRSISRSGKSMLDSIVAEILAVPTVTSVRVLENDTGSTDANGLPEHSVLAVVEGGSNSEVARAIFLKKATGISTSGNTSVVIKDTQGVDKTLLFSRPVLVPIFVRVDINTFADFPNGGVDTIKQNIVSYANGNLIQGKGFEVNENVIRTELFTPVNVTNGHSVSLIAINTGGNPQPSDTANINIGFDERASFTVDNIQVNIL